MRAVIAFLLLPTILLATGCTDEGLTTSSIATSESEASVEKAAARHYTFSRFLSGTSSCDNDSESASCLYKKNPKGTPGFSGPLFGLGAAPDGDILIADNGAGIAREDNGSGILEVHLPQATDVSPIGRGAAWATTGPSAGNGTFDSGQGLHRTSLGNTRKIANLFAFESANDPDGTGIHDSNPFDVQSLGGNAALVADAAANALLRIDSRGNVKVLAVFPPALVSTSNLQTLVGCPTPFIPDLAFICDVPMMPAQAVPTSVAIGPDGNYYVGELKGFPAPTGVSNIWRVSPNASSAACGASPDCVEVFDGGFTSIIDLAFDEDGLLHVAELDEASWFGMELGMGVGGTINACDLTTLSCSSVAAGIPILSSIAFGKNGSLWATRNALIPPIAEVVQIQ